MQLHMHMRMAKKAIRIMNNNELTKCLVGMSGIILFLDDRFLKFRLYNVLDQCYFL